MMDQLIAGDGGLPVDAGRRGQAHFKLRPKDAELLQRLRRGDAAAFKEMVDQFSDELFGLAYSLTGNAADAEDVLQQTFLGAFRRIGAFEGRSSIKTWLVRIVANQASKSRRSRRIRRAVPIDERLATIDGAPAPQVSSAEACVDSRIDLADMLQQLSPEHREVLVLREVQQMSYEQISQALKLPQGTVESRLFRARQDLRRRFAKHFK
jgi:RNA polymerase sigma-70 factor (ECF subfamily)